MTNTPPDKPMTSYEFLLKQSKRPVSKSVPQQEHSPSSLSPSSASASASVEPRNHGNVETRKDGSTEPRKNLTAKDDEQSLQKYTFAFAEKELEALEDIKFELRRKHDIKVAKNDLVRCSLWELLEDYKHHGPQSRFIQRLTPSTPKASQ